MSVLDINDKQLHSLKDWTDVYYNNFDASKLKN